MPMAKAAPMPSITGSPSCREPLSAAALGTGIGLG